MYVYIYNKNKLLWTFGELPLSGTLDTLRAPSIKPCTSGSLEELQVRVHGSTGPRASGSVELTIFVGIYPLVN